MQVDLVRFPLFRKRAFLFQNYGIGKGTASQILQYYKRGYKFTEKVLRALGQNPHPILGNFAEILKTHVPGYRGEPLTKCGSVKLTGKVFDMEEKSELVSAMPIACPPPRAESDKEGNKVPEDQLPVERFGIGYLGVLKKKRYLAEGLSRFGEELGSLQPGTTLKILDRFHKTHEGERKIWFKVEVIDQLEGSEDEDGFVPNYTIGWIMGKSVWAHESVSVDDLSDIFKDYVIRPLVDYQEFNLTARKAEVIEQRMETFAAHSSASYLQRKDRLIDVLSEDCATLQNAGIGHDTIASLLQSIALGLTSNYVVVIDGIRFSVERIIREVNRLVPWGVANRLTPLYCPWGEFYHSRENGYLHDGKLDPDEDLWFLSHCDYKVTNESKGEVFRFPAMLIHLIREHRFFMRGAETGYNTTPKHIIEYFGLEADKYPTVEVLESPQQLESYKQHSETLRDFNLTPETALLWERRMRPAALSSAGFLGAKEDLIEVLVEDRNILHQLGFSYQDIADFLEDLLFNVKHYEIRVNGEKYTVRITSYLGSQMCFCVEHPPADRKLFYPNYGDLTRNYDYFTDSPGTSDDVTITNQQTGEEIGFSGLLPHLIKAHSFFEGKDTSYRLDPKRLIGFFKLRPNEKPTIELIADSPE